MYNDYNTASTIQGAHRSTFYKKTYTHLAGALLTFIAVETLLLLTVPAELIFQMISTKTIWLVLLGMVWLISIWTDKLVHNPSKSMQYMGLAIYILIEAIIFLPLIYMALIFSEGPYLIQQAGILTLGMFIALTATVFLTTTNFSVLRSALTIGGILAIACIIAGAIFGFDLGLWFSAAMVVLASGSILYQTHQLKYDFNNDQYVAAALKLFASILLLFWYILRILMSRRD